MERFAETLQQADEALGFNARASGGLKVWPVDDLSDRNGYRKALSLYAPPTHKELNVTGERWTPWRSVAAWYFWRMADAR